MAEPRTCERCGRVRTIVGHEMCGACYQTVRRRRDPDHKAKHAAAMLKWRHENPEKAKAIEKRRSKTERRKKWKAKYHREYYDEHQEELCQYQRDWRRANPKQRDHYKIRRRNKLKGLPATLTFDEWEAIKEKYGHRCAYCQVESSELVREHMLPADRGGGFTKENIVPSCRSCNASKKTMTAQEFIDSGHAKNPHPVLLARLLEPSQPVPFRFVQLQFGL